MESDLARAGMPARGGFACPVNINDAALGLQYMTAPAPCCITDNEAPLPNLVVCLQAAEQIVVLDNGRVAEVGSHKELTDRGGQYARLVSTQSLSVSNV